MSRNILIITQRVDENDDLLGFFVDWLREFSKSFDRVFVITFAKGSYNLPENVEVHSLGKEENKPKILWAFNFYKYLFKFIPKSRAVFAHMSPILVIASWPASFIYRKKIIFWYLHRSVTFKLRLAVALSYKVVTAAKESLKFKSNKIIETGHGINVDKFKVERNWAGGNQLRILSVGRISRIKNYETLIEAAKMLRDGGVDFKVQIIGQPILGPDFVYFDSLKTLSKKLGLESLVEFVGFVPYSNISEYYRKSDLVVGLTPHGGIDKTVLEGMASGCLVLTSNVVNSKYFENYEKDFIFRFQDAEDLFDKIRLLWNYSFDGKKERSDFLLRSVSKYHNLANVINKISSLA